MWKDPIVEEVRKAGEKLAERAGYDIKRFAETLRTEQRTTGHKVVSFEKRIVPVKT
jgi:hypothetical protein